MAYQNELMKIPSEHRSAHKIAQDFMDISHQETGKHIKLCYNTIIRRANGGRSRAKVDASRAWLTEEEVIIVIEYIIEIANRGFLLSHLLQLSPGRLQVKTKRLGL